MATAVTLAIILLTPSALAGAVVWLPRALRALRSLREPPGEQAHTAGPPVERTAADLRRLMAEHAAVRTSRDVAFRGRRLEALEGAITDCALDAARAVDLAAPLRSGRDPLSRRQLQLLLTDLAKAGLALPSADRFGR